MIIIVNKLFVSICIRPINSFNRSRTIISPQYVGIGIATKLRGGQTGFDSRHGQDIFYSPQHSDRVWSPPTLLCNGYRGLSLGVERPRLEAGRSPPSGAEVKNGVAIPSLPPIHFHGTGTLGKCKVKLSL
jgi:hypothetical protein